MLVSANSYCDYQAQLPAKSSVARQLFPPSPQQSPLRVKVDDDFSLMAAPYLGGGVGDLFTQDVIHMESPLLLRHGHSPCIPETEPSQNHVFYSSPMFMGVDSEAGSPQHRVASAHMQQVIDIDPVLMGIKSSFDRLIDKRHMRESTKNDSGEVVEKGYFDSAKVDAGWYTKTLRFFKDLSSEFPEVYKAIGGEKCGKTVFIGPQGSGKTTVSGCVTGCPTEVKHGTSTKQAIVYTYVRCEKFKALVRDDTEPAECGKTCHTQQELQEYLATTQQKIPGKISDKVLNVYIEDPDCTEMVLVDLPGYISHEPESDRKIRMSVYDKFLNDPYNLYVFVVNGDTEIETVDVAPMILDNVERCPLTVIVRTKAKNSMDAQSNSDGEAMSLFKNAMHPWKSGVSIPEFGVDIDLQTVKAVRSCSSSGREELLQASDKRLLEAVSYWADTPISPSGAKKVSEIPGFQLCECAFGVKAVESLITFVTATALQHKMRAIPEELAVLHKQWSASKTQAQMEVSGTIESLCLFYSQCLDRDKFLVMVKGSSFYDDYKVALKEQFANIILGPLALTQEISDENINGNAKTLHKVCEQISKDTIVSSEEGALSVDQASHCEELIRVSKAFERQLNDFAEIVQSCSIDRADWKRGRAPMIVNHASVVKAYKEKVHTQCSEEIQELVLKFADKIIVQLNLPGSEVKQWLLKIGFDDQSIRKMFVQIRQRVTDYIAGDFCSIKEQLRAVEVDTESDEFKSILKAYSEFCACVEGKKGKLSLDVDSIKTLLSEHKSKAFLIGKLIAGCTLFVVATGAVVSSAGAALPLVAGATVVGGGAAAGKSKVARKGIGFVFSGLGKALSKVNKKISSDASKAHARDKERSDEKARQMAQHANVVKSKLKGEGIMGDVSHQSDSIKMSTSDLAYSLALVEAELAVYFDKIGERVLLEQCPGICNRIRESILKMASCRLGDEYCNPDRYKGSPAYKNALAKDMLVKLTAVLEQVREGL